MIPATLPIPVSVVMATHRREALLARTLAALADCPRPAGFRGTLVVENGSRGAAEGVVAEAPAAIAARHLFEPAGNKCRALNAGLAHVDDGLVIFLDDDVRPSPGLLLAYASAAAAHGPGHFFGGPVHPDYEEAPPSWLTEFLPPSARAWQPDPVAVRTKPFFLGFNWAAYVADLRRVGGFDERFGPGTPSGLGDEAAIQRPLMAAGVVPVVVPEALVHHWVPRDRCSPAWLLDRAYRTGLRDGMHRIGIGDGPAVAGYPLGVMKRLAVAWVRTMAARPRGGAAERLAAALKLQRQRGLLEGVRRHPGLS